MNARSDARVDEIRAQPQAQPAYDRRLETVLDSAEAVFARDGFHAASMRDIAQAVGISIAGLYYYLSSKHEALYFVCDRVFERIEAAAHELDLIGDATHRLKNFVRAHLHYMIDHRDAYRVLLRDMEALQGDFRKRVHERRRRYFALASALVDELANNDARVSPRLAAGALFGMLNWAPTWYQSELDGDVDALADKILALFLHGYSPASGRSYAARYVTELNVS
jgi:AcrR family transcriptional regulator